MTPRSHKLALNHQSKKLLPCQARLLDDCDQRASVQFWMKWDGDPSSIGMSHDHVFPLPSHSKTDSEEGLDDVPS